MRRAKDLLLRLLLTLALIVAAWPVAASAPACASSLHSGGVGEERGRCPMPCCAKRAMAGCMAHPKAERAKRLGVTCGCQVAPAPTLPASTKALPGVPVAALPAARLLLTILPALETAPGHVGFDAGPPPDPPRLGDASRAPPVVRA